MCQVVLLECERKSNGPQMRQFKTHDTNKAPSTSNMAVLNVPEASNEQFEDWGMDIDERKICLIYSCLNVKMKASNIISLYIVTLSG